MEATVGSSTLAPRLRELAGGGAHATVCGAEMGAEEQLGSEAAAADLVTRGLEGWKRDVMRIQERVSEV